MKRKLASLVPQHGAGQPTLSVGIVGMGAIGWEFARHFIGREELDLTLYSRSESLRKLHERAERRKCASGSPDAFVQLGERKLRLGDQAGHGADFRMAAWDVGFDAGRAVGEEAVSRTPGGPAVLEGRGGEESSAPLSARHDIVIVCVKAHFLRDNERFLRAVAALAGGEDSVIVLAQNGVPFWYPDWACGDARLVAASAEGRLPSLHSQAIARHLPVDKVVGMVLRLEAWFDEVADDSDVVLRPLSKLAPVPLLFGSAAKPLGERGQSDRKERLVSQLFADIGRVPGCEDGQAISRDIRSDVWFKLLGNCSINPLSVLTEMHMRDLANSEEGTFVLTRAMDEVFALVDELREVDCETGKQEVMRPLPVKTAEERLQGPRGGDPAFKASTLQDFEAGRSLEVEALLDTVVELGRAVGKACPTLELMAALVKLRARQRGIGY